MYSDESGEGCLRESFVISITPPSVRGLAPEVPDLLAFSENTSLARPHSRQGAEAAHEAMLSQTIDFCQPE